MTSQVKLTRTLETAFVHELSEVDKLDRGLFSLTPRVVQDFADAAGAGDDVAVVV